MNSLRLVVLGLLVAALAACSQTPSEPAPSAPSSSVSASQQPQTDQAEQEADSPEPETETDQEASAETPKDPEPSSEPKENESSQTPAPAPKPSSSKSASPAPSQTPAESPTPVGYTRAQVSEKNSRTTCWAIVGGSVYDLTDWISKHPGGASAITSLCGTDATASFDAQHGGQARPSSTLDAYYLGPLLD